MTKDITNEILAAASNKVMADPYVVQSENQAVASFITGLMVGVLIKLMDEKRARIVVEDDALGNV